MKKLCILILCLLALLCGCLEQSDLPDYRTLLITDGQTENPGAWSWFYWDTYMGNAAELEICYQQDGTVSNVSLRFDGTFYTITDESGTRTYKHLIHSPMQGPGNAAYDYAEIFLLSDDPDMTSERFLQAALSSSTLLQELAPTRIIYADYHSFSRAENYGTVPTEVSHIMDSFSPSSRIIWEKNSYHVISYTASSSVRITSMITRYDYKGTLLSQATVKGAVGTILELDNGGFVAESDSYPDDLYLLTCCNPDGSISWQHNFDPAYDYYFPHILEQGQSIYMFGKRGPDSGSDDIYICRFSSDGQLLQEKLLGGSDFEWIKNIVEAENGFMLYGCTQSRDGDLPFSSDGYGVDFSAHVSSSLEISNINKLEDGQSSYTDIIGYHGGQPINSDDPILDTHETDRLPNEKDRYGHLPYSVQGFFDLEDGYVIIRDHRLDYSALSYPIASYVPSYRELIITGYDSSGTPVWQTTSDIYVS